MAINSKNYVDISTSFPKTDSTSRAFGGMVLTPTAIEQGEDSPYAKVVEDYNSGLDIALSLDDVIAVFGVKSKEYSFAKGYYSYSSPTGRFPSRLKFKKVDTSKSLLENFVDLDTATNDFGSFTFLPPDDTSTAAESDYFDELFKVAQQNATLETKYLFVVNQKAKEGGADYSTSVENCKAFKDLPGVCFVYGSSDVSAYMPMAILASTDYNDGTVVNFMFKQFPGEVPTVFGQQAYQTLNGGWVNFYGRSQTNGQTFDFFQRGFNTNGVDTAIYCNEMWFKAECETALMNLLISQEKFPADQSAVSMVKLTVAEVCGIAQRNGSFMAKEASNADAQAIREIVLQSGGAGLEAEGIVTDVSTSGYSIYAYLSQDTNTEKLGPTTEKIIVYYVFYGTADNVRYIKGYNILLK